MLTDENTENHASPEDNATEVGHAALAGAGAVEAVAPRGPRKDQLANGSWEHEGRTAYIVPDQEIIAGITAETGGKVQYWGPDHVKARGEMSFLEEVMAPLYGELMRRYPDRHLAFRAVMTSINGHLKDGMGVGSDILDISETMRAGAEKPNAVFNVAVRDPDEDDWLSLNRVTQYAYGVGFLREWEADPEVADNLFPAILVFDTAGLRKREGFYSVSFDPDQNPEDVLLGGFILDCPTTE